MKYQAMSIKRGDPPVVVGGGGSGEPPPDPDGD